MGSEYEAAGTNIAVMKFSRCIVLDRYALRIFVSCALKESPVMVGLIRRFDERQQHRKPAHSAGPRHVLRLIAIIDMRLRHGAHSTL